MKTTISNPVRRLLNPPVFPGDEDKTRVVGVLNNVLLIASFFTLLSGVTLFVVAERLLNLAIIVVFFSVELVTLWLVRRGYVRSSTVFFSIALWFSISGVAFAYGGVQIPTPFVYIIVILLVGITLEGRAVIWYTALCIASGLGLFIIGTTRIVPPLLPPPPPFVGLVIQIITFAWTGLAVFTARQRLNDALAYARQNERALAESNRELQATRASLEQRLADRTHDLEQRNRQLLAFQSAGAAITSILDLPHGLETVAREMAELLEADFCAISVWDQEGDTVVTLYEHGPEGWWDETRREVFPLADYPLTKKVLVERCARQVNAADADADPAELAFMQEVDVKNLLMLPMVSRDRAVGLVEIIDPSERPLTAQEIGLAQLLANQAASAIENAQLYEQARREIGERQRAEAALQTYAIKLEQSNRELQDFLYAASHDLQEPLRKVQAFGDRLQSQYGEVLDERGRDYLTRMRSVAARMQTLINDLLVYSRVTNRSEPFKWVDLAQLARGVVDDFTQELQQLGGWVEIGDLPAIEADPVQMRYLLQHLIGNALKFRRQDAAPTVKIQARMLNGESGRLRGGAAGSEMCQITVVDNGIGFEEKYVGRIFQVFGRLHGRNEYEGTGIGLAICRKIAEHHGGSITASSTPGQGATFVVNLHVSQLER